MPQANPQLPQFVSAHQAAQQALKQQLRRQALQRVRQLTNEGPTSKPTPSGRKRSAPSRLTLWEC